MSRIENTGQIKTGYSVKSGTNPEEKVENGSDFASMLTKYQKKAAQNDETKKAETGETKNKETHVFLELLLGGLVKMGAWR